MSDNTTTVYEINSMGYNKSDICKQIIFDIWSWVEISNSWIISAYIPVKENSDADGESSKNSKI